MTPSPPLWSLGVGQILAGLRDARFAAADVVRACLERIAAREPMVGAWTALAGEAAVAEAEVLQAPGPLGGVPFGAKDVLDTGGLPTEMGSALYAGHRPRFDAGVVGLARLTGAILLGKTVTAEFAGTPPTATRNPHDPAHSPGGSSSGSAAAVADGMVPFAFGTQTGGSVLRPAAFCGVVGFKPTYGFYPVAGMKPAAHSFDTVGTLARSVGDVALVHAALMNDRVAVRPEGAPRLALVRTHLWPTVEQEAAAALEATVSRLAAAGAHVEERTVPEGFDGITEARAVINAFERARGLAGEWRLDGDRMAPQTAEVCRRGMALDGAQYAAARRAVAQVRRSVAALFDGVDALLTPVAPGPAPRGLDWAGDPRLQELWTMLHLPSLTLPVPEAMWAGARLPLGVQLVGAACEDARLLSAALWAEARLAVR